MKLKRSLLLNIILAFVSASVILCVSQREFLKRFELSTYDFFFRLRGPIPCNPRIVIVDISDFEIAKVGGWPWKRSWHAAMFKALKELGAKYIFSDIIFAEASSEEEDALLEEALKDAGNVYLPFALQDSVLGIEKELIPIERFLLRAKGTGAANICLDIDGTLRELPIIFPLPKEEVVYPHVALKIAMDCGGFNIKDITPDYVTISSSEEEIKIPLVEKNRMLINWLGVWERSFKRYGFLDVLVGYKNTLENKKPKINIDDFKDSVCLVGITATAIYDRRSIPLQSEYPGVGVIATAISNILDRNFLYKTPFWINALALYVLALIPSFLISGEKPLKETLFALLIGGVYSLASFLLFSKGVIIAFTPVLLGFLASFLTTETYNFIRAVAEKQRFFKLSIIDELSGLYNVRFFRRFLENEIRLAHSDPAKGFLLMMSDIDYFKHINDNYGHQVGDLAIKKVADIFKASVHSSDVVARYGGDEIIALLRQAPLKEALNIAERIRKNVESCVIKDYADNQHKVTISVGMTAFKKDDTIYTVIKRADKALYKAKEAGRNRVFYLEDADAAQSTSQPQQGEAKDAGEA